MDIRKVKKLIEMLEDSNLEEIEIQEGEESVRLVKKGTVSVQTNLNPEIIEKGQNLSPKNVATPSSEHKTEESNTYEGELISSPMVGTFYSAASPGAKPFVSVGDTIAEGDIVCIVEAMKMMNEIKSEVSGTVKSILVENSEPVEYGQALFEISD